MTNTNVYHKILFLFLCQNKILKININTVSTNLARAKKELKNILEEGGEYNEINR